MLHEPIFFLRNYTYFSRFQWLLYFVASRIITGCNRFPIHSVMLHTEVQIVLFVYFHMAFEFLILVKWLYTTEVRLFLTLLFNIFLIVFFLWRNIAFFAEILYGFDLFSRRFYVKNLRITSDSGWIDYFIFTIELFIFFKVSVSLIQYYLIRYLFWAIISYLVNIKIYVLTWFAYINRLIQVVNILKMIKLTFINISYTII